MSCIITITSSTGHEPHEVIPPHDPNGDDPDSPKALITVAEALFYADTEQGKCRLLKKLG